MIDSSTFRNVMGNYPTGVCVITAQPENAPPLALVVGSFTSVSLDPPLVGFLPAKISSTWPLIENAKSFCINILASDQLDLCRKMAKSGDSKFDGVEYRASSNGSPLLDGVIATIDCALHDVVDAGDHVFVMGLVQEMRVERDADPMLFCKGKYGGFRES